MRNSHGKLWIETLEFTLKRTTMPLDLCDFIHVSKLVSMHEVVSSICNWINVNIRQDVALVDGLGLDDEP